MKRRELVLLLAAALTTLTGCARWHEADMADAGTPADDADFAPTDAGACELRWLDEAPLRRARSLVTEPAIAGDHDGFLFVTTAMGSDAACPHDWCVVVERLPSSGEGAVVTTVDLETAVDGRFRLFATTDESGAGHFAAASSVPSEASGVTQGWTAGALVWGGSDPSTWNRALLDPARGLAAVAVERDRAWVVTHAWQPETSWGEGFSYPVAPRVLRIDPGGAIEDGPPLDPTAGELFFDAELARAGSGLWLVTWGYPDGHRAAGPGWSGALPLDGRCVATGEPSGSVVLACEDEGAARVVRLREDGSSQLGPTIVSDDGSLPSIVASADGERLVVATVHDGAVVVTELDAMLQVRARGTAPAMGPLDRGQTRLAAANDGVFALVVTRPLSGGMETPRPVDIHRFVPCP